MSDLTFDVDRCSSLFEEEFGDFSSYLDFALTHLIREQERRKAGCKEKPEDFVWTTRDGTRVQVSAMTDQHLNNTITFVRRNLEYIDEQMPF